MAGQVSGRPTGLGLILVSEVKDRDGIELFWLELFSPVESLYLPFNGMLRDDVIKDTPDALLVDNVVATLDGCEVLLPCGR